MAESLVIVESPGKIRTIKKYLGNDFEVMSSVGHIRDLPKETSAKYRFSYSEWQQTLGDLDSIGVDPQNNWKVNYVVPPEKAKTVKQLRAAGRKATRIYLATDLDREGEAIAWHLQEVIGGDPGKFIRVVFNEITETAIHDAFAKPGIVNENRVNAQQARLFLDRVVGFELSPLLNFKIGRGLSAGRVQSVAVRLIVEREREIRAFNPKEYWDATAYLTRSNSDNAEPAMDRVAFDVAKYRSDDFNPSSETETSELLQELEQQAFSVSSHDSRINSRRASAPFITTTMQQTASTRLNFNVRRTMTAAQRLYEAGLITYMRTDSTNVSAEALSAVREFIGSQYDRDPAQGDYSYLPATPNTFKSASSSQEAHEAIRPTDVTLRQASARGVTDDATKLYSLIWSRFVASQMTPARFENTSTTVLAGDFELRRSASVRIFDGYQKVYSADEPPKADPVVAFRVGESLHCIETTKEQHFTKPPPRYSEARLIRELESKGIGRPSTYSTIITTIQARGYVSLQNKRFFAAKIGEVVTDRLIESFKKLMSYDFTAEMENELDEIAVGEKNFTNVLDEFYADFRSLLVEAKDPEHGMLRNIGIDTSVKCELCGRPMMLRLSKNGLFLGCSGYADRGKDRCRGTKSLTSDIDFETIVDDDSDAGARFLLDQKHCGTCNTIMTGWLIDEQTKLHICGNYPTCTGTAIETGNFRVKGYEGQIVECDKCGSDMHLKVGRFGKYFDCTNDACTNTRKLRKNGEVAPPRADPIPMPELAVEDFDDHYVLRDGLRGIFLAASKFPRVRKSRQVTVEELLAHGNELDPKLAYLLTAPTTNQDNGHYVVRYSTKNQTQYLSGEKNGKRDGWVAFYEEGKWNETKSLGKKPRTATKRTRKQSSR